MSYLNIVHAYLYNLSAYLHENYCNLYGRHTYSLCWHAYIEKFRITPQSSYKNY